MLLLKDAPGRFRFLVGAWVERFSKILIEACVKVIDGFLRNSSRREVVTSRGRLHLVPYDFGWRL